jgi:hypothetical protein
LRRLAKLFPTRTPFFMPHPVTSDRIWKEEEPRNYYDGGNDGLSLGGAKFKLGTALGLLEALESVRQDVIPGFTVPFMINHGTNDESVLIEGSIFLFENSATPAEDKVLNKVCRTFLLCLHSFVYLRLKIITQLYRSKADITIFIPKKMRRKP